MRVAIIHNKDIDGVINKFGMQNKEKYNQKTVTLVSDGLEKAGHNVKIIDGNMYCIEALQQFMPRVMEGEKMGMVFNMAYGIQGESRYTHLPSLLEMLGIPYVGSSPSGHALALDKIITKIIMQKHNIPTPDFWVYSTGDEDMADVTYPVIVKPKMEAVSFGLKVVHNENDLRATVKETIIEYQQQALVEQFIRGREFCVGILGNGDPETFPILEIDLNNNPDAIQSVDDKKFDPRGKICPANISDELAKQMSSLSKKAFNALGLKDFSRVDIRMDENNNIYLLEINSMASLGKTGSYVHAAAVAGYDYSALVNKILEVASTRYFSQETFFIEEEVASKKSKTPVTARIRAFLRSKHDYTKKTLAKLININNHVRNIDGVNSVSSLISNELKQTGFTSEVFPSFDLGNTVLLTNNGSENFDILFVGFTDSPTNYKKHINFSSTDYKISGTGTWEGKGGIAIMISALKTMKFMKKIKNLNIGILLTPDNSIYGKESSKYVSDFSQKASCVIGLSGSSISGSIITSRAGAALYDLNLDLVKAETAKDAADATKKFANLIAGISELSDENEGLLITPSDVTIDSGFSPAHTHCEAKLSFRFSAAEKVTNAIEKLNVMIKKAKSKKINITLRGSIKRIPLSPSKESEDFFLAIKKAADKMDIRITQEHRWSSSNICFATQGRPVVDGFGPLGDLQDDNREYVISHSLFDRASLLTLVMLNIAKEKTK